MNRKALIYIKEVSTEDDGFENIHMSDIGNMISNSYDVIQLNDVESKKLVIKALGEVFFPNQNAVNYNYINVRFFNQSFHIKQPSRFSQLIPVCSQSALL